MLALLQAGPPYSTHTTSGLSPAAQFTKSRPCSSSREAAWLTRAGGQNYISAATFHRRDITSPGWLLRLGHCKAGNRPRLAPTGAVSDGTSHAYRYSSWQIIVLYNLQYI